MDKLTQAEKCMILFAIGHAASSMGTGLDGKFNYDQAKPWMDLANKIIGNNIVLEEEAKE